MNRPAYILYLSIIFTTGLCSLGYQVIWQRYLSVLVGSHARSATIIVSVFLLGLALGYYVFGLLAERIKKRQQLLKTYGFVELATGFYAGIFPFIFEFFLESSISQTNNFWIHLFLAAVLLMPATFLMGATIPIMTTVLPESDENVALMHSRIYGLNTLGSFVGTLICGLYLITELGNALSLSLLALLNVFVSLFYIKNNLTGLVHEKKQPETLSHPFNQNLLYALAFVAGMTCLSLEILWFRILGLTIGNSFIVFPFILSIFVLMIGLGPLTLKRMDIKSFQKSFRYALIFSLLTFLTIPYLPLLISNIRVSFANHHLAFYLYHFFIYLIFLSLLSPAIFHLGRILPFIYSMIKKDNRDYGFKVGKLYFFNTLGTFFGAVFLGYLAFYLFGLKTIYLISLSFLFIAGIYFLKFRCPFQIILLLMALSSIWAPFPRKHHEWGLFRARIPKHMHFKNIFTQVNNAREGKKITYFQDGPNTTVSVLENINKTDDTHSKSILVNGKSDGNTVHDYSTTTLLSLVPYVMTKGNELKTMVIGIGTGISAGVLAKTNRVAHVDVVEISEAVIHSTKFMSPENLDFHKNPKTVIHENDAFQFLKSVDVRYDIIVSEPSNPWFVGIENLYTVYFYNLAKERMTDNGIFSQWMHFYSSSPEILTTILSNLKSVFKNVTIFYTRNGDLAFFASNRTAPFKIDADNIYYSKDLQKTIGTLNSLNKEKSPIIEPLVKEILNKIGIQRVSDLNFLTLYNSKEVDAIIKTNPSFSHKIFYPKLNKESYFAFYSGNRVDIHNLLNPLYQRIPEIEKVEPSKKKRLKEIIDNTDCNKERTYIHLPCLLFVQTYGLKRAMKDIDSSSVKKRIIAYTKLRALGLVKKDLSFIKKSMASLLPLKAKKHVMETSRLITNELLKEQEYSLAQTFIEKLESKKLIHKKILQALMKKIEKTKMAQQKLIQNFNNLNSNSFD